MKTHIKYHSNYGLSFVIAHSEDEVKRAKLEELKRIQVQKSKKLLSCLCMYLKDKLNCRLQWWMKIWSLRKEKPVKKLCSSLSLKPP